MSPLAKLFKCLHSSKPKDVDHRLDKVIYSNEATTKNCYTQESDERRALITGINGQVGSYLAELLLSKGYQVHGMIRRESSLNNSRLVEIEKHKSLHLHYGDLLDSNSLTRLLALIRPHEVYNLAAQSHVRVSFDMAELTGNTNALGTLRLLEAIRQFEQSTMNQHRVKFYQASTSELYGSARAPQNESTPFSPRSPYGCSKLYAHWLVINYRESYNLFALNGILFNHESPRRGEQFVTRKISLSVAHIKLGLREHFELGNLDARRDWGHARDYVEAMWLMMQQESARDYVIASGESHSVREFVELAFRLIGITIHWSGRGLDEVGVDGASGKVRVKIARQFFRPAEVDHLRGDSSLARRELKWKPRISFDQLVEEMVSADIKLLEQQKTQFNNKLI